MHAEERAEEPLDLDEASSSTSRKVGEVLRRALVTGMGGLLTTEEGLRSVMSELKLSKEALGFLLTQAERTKTDMSRALERELHAVLQSVDVKRLLQRALSGMVVEISAEVRFRPQEDADTGPAVKVTTRSKRQPAPRKAARKRAR